MQRIRVGIIGTGFGARVHAPILRAHPGFDVQAIASVTRGDSTRIQSESGVDRVYADWRQMLDREKLDLLVVASAPDLHREMAFGGFERGLHVLCEKPMALDIAEAESMCDAQRRAGRHGFINHEFRFRPARLCVREALRQGAIGDVVQVNYQNIGGGYLARQARRLNWLGSRSAGGGVLGAIGSHMFDSLRFWTGREVQNVSGQLETLVAEVDPDGRGAEHRTADDSFRTFGHLSGGIPFSLSYVVSSGGLARSELDIQGTEGCLRMVDDGHVLLARGDEALRASDLPALSPAPPQLPGSAARYPFLYPFVDRLHRMLTEGAEDPLMPTFADGLAVQGILDAVRRSSDEGRRIEVGA